VLYVDNLVKEKVRKYFFDSLNAQADICADDFPAHIVQPDVRHELNYTARSNDFSTVWGTWIGTKYEEG
jgi:hypothetical protein